MAFLQSSGQISLNQIRNIFGGGSGQIGLKAFYRAGGRVPDDAFCHNNTVPSSGQISARNFWNTSNGTDYVGFSSDNSSNQTARFHTIQPNVTRVQIWAVGGGGGGGYIYSFGAACISPGPTTRRVSGAASGGGGAGWFGQINVQPGGSVQINVGKGGPGQLLSTSSGGIIPVLALRGHQTVIFYNGSQQGTAGSASGANINLQRCGNINQAFGGFGGGVGTVAGGDGTGQAITDNSSAGTAIHVPEQAGGVSGYSWQGGNGGRAGSVLMVTRVADAGVNGGATLRY